VSKGANSGLAESVKQRLLNLSAVRGETFNVLLMRYGVERLLYRISRSPHADAFVLGLHPDLMPLELRGIRVISGLNLDDPSYGSRGTSSCAARTPSKRSFPCVVH